MLCGWTHGNRLTELRGLFEARFVHTLTYRVSDRRAFQYDKISVTALRCAFHCASAACISFQMAFKSTPSIVCVTRGKISPSVP